MEWARMITASYSGEEPFKSSQLYNELIAFSGSPLVAKKGNTMNKKMVVI